MSKFFVCITWLRQTNCVISISAVWHAFLQFYMFPVLYNVQYCLTNWVPVNRSFSGHSWWSVSSLWQYILLLIPYSLCCRGGNVHRIHLTSVWPLLVIEYYSNSLSMMWSVVPWFFSLSAGSQDAEPSHNKLSLSQHPFVNMLLWNICTL